MDIKIEKKKGLKAKHVIYGLVGLAFITLIYFAFFGNSKSTYRIEKDKLTIATIEKNIFHDYITINGYVEPISTIYLDAREGGRVEEKVAEEGQMLQKGDVILRLSNPDLSLSILNSEAQLAEKSNFLRNTMVTMEQEKLQIKRELLNLEFDIKRKKRQWKQMKELYTDSLVSHEEYLKAEEDYQFAKKSFSLYMERQKQDSIYRSIQVRQMEDNLNNMQKNLKLVRERQEHLNVKSPIDGQLTILDIELGQSVPKGGRLGQIHVLTSYKVVAEIDEHYIDKVKVGLTAILERKGQEYTLKIRKVHPDVQSGRFKIELVFTEKAPDNMRTGQTYYSKLQLGNPKEALLLKKGSFFQSTGGRWIYVLNENESSAERMEIKLGSMNPRYYEVIEGLKTGDKVIISDYDLFKDNERIVFK
jgi:HlyD family secretion protein